MNFDVTDFEPMRPFRDDEIPAVMRRICNDVHFPLIAKWVYPEKNAEEVKDILYEFTDIRDFQVETMRRVNERILNTTTDGLTCDGFDNLDKDKRYLFISNHRDIMLDACFLQYLLWQNGHETSEITFGSNLMGLQIVDDIG
ncbi:MAG: acyltransferase, partial [Bacteroidetes bacterium]|nr:acyltransferase [Candidatus Enterocola intestinipullorum]